MIKSQYNCLFASFFRLLFLCLSLVSLILPWFGGSNTALGSRNKPSGRMRRQPRLIGSFGTAVCILIRCILSSCGHNTLLRAGRGCQHAAQIILALIAPRHSPAGYMSIHLTLCSTQTLTIASLCPVRHSSLGPVIIPSAF